PLIGVAADEAVEVVEAHASRPLIERPGLACLEFGSIVFLAEPGCAVAVILEDSTNGRLIARHDAVVAGVARRYLRDDAESHRMMISAGDECGARWRTQRGRIEIRVPQAVGGDAV